MPISTGKVLMIIGGVAALGIILALIFLFPKQGGIGLNQGPGTGNEISAAGTQGVQFTFGGERSPAPGAAGQGAAPGVPASSFGGTAALGNVFAPNALGVRGINLNGNVNLGVSGGLSGIIQAPNYAAPSFSNILKQTFPFGITSSSIFDILSLGATSLPQDTYTKNLINQYNNILAAQQKLSSFVQSQSQNIPVIPTNLVQGVSGGGATISLSAVQGILNGLASTTADFSREFANLNNQQIDLFNSEIAQAKSSGANSAYIDSLVNQFNQFNSQAAALNQRAQDFSNQNINFLNQITTNSSGTVSAADVQNFLSQFNSNSATLGQETNNLINQAYNLQNNLNLLP